MKSHIRNTTTDTQTERSFLLDLAFGGNLHEEARRDLISRAKS